jgi:hypothetical protein
VAGALRVTGRGKDAGFSRYYDVLSRSRWSALAGAGLLLGRLVATFVPAGPVVIGLDDTIERPWGAKIAARGIYRDPVRSSHGHFVKASGLRWLSAMLLVPVPWVRRVWALPFLTLLMPSQRWADRRGVRHKSLVDGARQMLLQVARWLPDRRIVAVADSGFSAIDLLDAACPVCVVTRLRLDARLFAPSIPRRPGTRGRPRRTGERLPTLAQRLAGPTTVWSTHVVTDWYGQGERRVELATGCAVWSHPGRPVVPLRWLIVRDPDGRFRPQAFLSTDPDIEPADMLAWFIRRWSIEVTFAEVRRHLGVETQVSGPTAPSPAPPPCGLACFPSSPCSQTTSTRPGPSPHVRHAGTPSRPLLSAMRLPQSGDNCGPTRLSPCPDTTPTRKNHPTPSSTAWSILPATRQRMRKVELRTPPVLIVVGLREMALPHCQFTVIGCRSFGAPLPAGGSSTKRG